MKKKDMPFFLRGGFSYAVFSVLCVLAGLLLGFLVLLCLNAEGAFGAVMAMLKNFFYYKRTAKVLYYFGSTLVKTVPLLLCSLSVLFAQKTGLFNIGASGQYTVGAGAALWCALAWHLPWYACLLAACLAGALYGALAGVLKAWNNVNEVISGIMLNWIALYGVNALLSRVQDSATGATFYLEDEAPASMLPGRGMGNLFGGNTYVGIGLFFAALAVAAVWVILKKTKLGYELCATGFNPDAAKYCGMNKNKNTVLAMAIAGGLAGLGAALLYLTDIDHWNVTASSVASMGFDGIAAAYLGGLDPIGVVFSSFFIRHITLGGGYIDQTKFSVQTANMVSALIIYFCAFVMIARQSAIRLYTKKKTEKSKKEDG